MSDQGPAHGWGSAASTDPAGGPSISATEPARTLTLITEQIFARVPGGTGRYTREVAEAVGAAVPAGWRARGVTAWHRSAAPARVDGLAGPSRLPFDPRVLARLWERGLGPTLPGTVVHALTPLAPARLRRGQRLIITVHDAVPFTHPETLTPRGAAWHRLMIERGARLASALVVPTAAVAEELAVVGIRARVEVIGEGAAQALNRLVTSDDIEQVRATFGLPDRYAVTVGTLEPRKGLDVLLDALAGEPAAALHLAVVGQPGWGGSDVAAAAEQRGVADRVHVLGRIPDAQLAAVLAGAAVSVVPSRAEGFGLPLLEAMTRGIPVVHTDVGALVEVAGGAGLVVPVGDSAALRAGITAVLTDPALAARLSEAGRTRAAEYSWAAVADRLWALYRDVVTASR